MQKLSKLSILIFIVSFFSIKLFALDKDEAFNKLNSNYGNITSISFSFKIEDAAEKGTIKAVKGNKFIISIGDRQIISNGKNLWNYSIKDKKVMLSDYDNSSSLSNIDEILINLTKYFNPISLIKENSSKKGSNYVLILQNSDEKLLKNITQIKIWSNNDFKDINAIEIKSKKTTSKFELSNIKINPKLDNSIFDFKVPNNAELIDLR